MIVKRTRNVALQLAVTVGIVAFGLTHAVPVAGQDDADAAAKIAMAMSAAPASVSAEATIYDLNVDDAGNFIVLREGSNGWSCFPDAPGTPATDPMCLDQTWMGWLAALVAREDPNTTAPGFAYMLQGGSDGSNTDPFATEPVAGEEWVSSPAHIMLLMPAALDPSVISTDHHSGHPYIMWAGTPYEHIMMPVADLALDDQASAISSGCQGPERLAQGPSARIPRFRRTTHSQNDPRQIAPLRSAAAAVATRPLTGHSLHVAPRVFSGGAAPRMCA